MTESLQQPSRPDDPPALAFRQLFEASSEVLLVLRPDSPQFTMVAATEARLAATHTTREQIIGRPLFEIFPDNPDDPGATGTSALRASLERVLATGAPDTMPVQRYDIRGPDGRFETKYWSPKNLPVLSSSGEVLYLLHRVEDVTDLVLAIERGDELRNQSRAMEREIIRRGRELAHANQELREANAQLGRLDAAKTVFFSNVSHEFRTPLTLILGPVEDALSREAPLGGEALRAVHRSAVRLTRLVNTLLDFSRLEAGRLHSRFEPTELATLTAGVAGAFQSLIESAGLTFVVACPPLRQPVFVDRNHWEKIVSNLLSNAFKFTLAGRVVVELQEHDERVELRVSDTGIGIPASELERIFERFHRVEASGGRSFEGTGIGLALVKELVDQHQGQIVVESVAGQGTTFRIFLPLGCDHLPPDRVVAAGAEPAPTMGHLSPFVLEAGRWSTPAEGEPMHPQSKATPEGSRARILVVDDNADMRSHIVGILSRHWTVDAAADGRAALELIEMAVPDLVLSDVMMPHLDGYGLLRALRQAPATQSVPVILLSARVGEDDLVEGLETGADSYLHKPFSARELVARVRTYLDAARTRTRALRATEARLRHLAESGLIGLTVCDERGHIVEANDAFARMVGHSLEDLLANDVLSELHGPRKAPATPGPFETELRLRDGRRIPVLVAATRLESGETICVTLDLTETKRLEAQFHQAQKLEAVGRLAAGIAHDFNNLLAVILGYADLVAAEGGPDLPFGEEIREIRQAALRATELTKQLLAFSRQQAVDVRVLSLAETVDSIKDMLARVLGEDIRLGVSSHSGLWSIEADPGRLEQVIMNLAVNARDAMPDGGTLTIETANVVLEASRVAEPEDVPPGRYVALTVSDTGIGMDRETRSRIFEPFFTTKAPGTGTGLGLATVFAIVRQANGHISVASRPGRGSTFEIHFPSVDASPPQRVVERSDTPGGCETVLLVEDQPQVRALAARVLRRAGYVVLEASTGSEALLLAEGSADRIDLLLTDVVLPLMNGRQVAERIRALRPAVKVLFTSGYTGDVAPQPGLLDLGSAFLQKPFTASGLTRAVREVLDRPGRA